MPFDSNQYNNFELVKTHFHGTFLLGTILNFSEFRLSDTSKIRNLSCQKRDGRIIEDVAIHEEKHRYLASLKRGKVQSKATFNSHQKRPR